MVVGGLDTRISARADFFGRYPLGNPSPAITITAAIDEQSVFALLPELMRYEGALQIAPISTVDYNFNPGLGWYEFTLTATEISGPVAKTEIPITAETFKGLTVPSYVSLPGRPVLG